MKPYGAALIFLGGFAVYWEFSRSQRRRLVLIRDLADALNQLAGEIRWKILPLPEAIAHLSDRRISGSFFREIHQSVVSGNALQDAWENAFQKLSPEIGGILLHIEWGGDLTQQEGSVLYAARQMRKLGEKKQDALHQRQKLCAAAAMSAAGLLVLILM